MRLYHGTNTSFDTIDLRKSRLSKDFGRGFYLSDNYAQALEMARHKAKREGGEVLVQEYLFDEKALEGNSLKVKRFDGYTAEWVNFILLNRENKSAVQAHEYDIVIGPIADDTVGLQLFRFRKRYINIENLIENLKYKDITIQYFFATEKAISYLKPK